jgi:hypothetical protein
MLDIVLVVFVGLVPVTEGLDCAPSRFVGGAIVQILWHLPPLGDVFTGDLSLALLMRLGLRRTLAFEDQVLVQGDRHAVVRRGFWWMGCTK